jgi:hypothetical protein
VNAQIFGIFKIGLDIARFIATHHSLISRFTPYYLNGNTSGCGEMRAVFATHGSVVPLKHCRIFLTETQKAKMVSGCRKGKRKVIPVLN